MDDVWFHRFPIHKVSEAHFSFTLKSRDVAVRCRGRHFFSRSVPGLFHLLQRKLKLLQHPWNKLQAEWHIFFCPLRRPTCDASLSKESSSSLWLSRKASDGFNTGQQNGFRGSSLTPKRWLARVVSVLSPPRLLRPALCVHSRDLFFFFMLPTAALYSTNSTGTPARLADRRRGS